MRVNVRHATAAAALAVAGLAAMALSAAGGAGPDIIVGDLTGSPFNTWFRYWGESGGIRAYSFGTTSCNIGDEPADWYDVEPFPTQHPVIAQNVYRLRDGRFEQIGMSWLKHGFCAIQDELCSTCEPYGGGGGCLDELGPGCADTYFANGNGSQSSLGPRSEVNGTSGEIMVWPHSMPSFAVLEGRIQIDAADLDPAQNEGARYFAEGHYVAADDAAAGHGNNNASWREATVDGTTIIMIGETVREQPAIHAWAAIDPGVEITAIDVPGDGRFHLASRVTDNGDGTWHYEYALYNMNAHRAARRLTVPLGDATAVSSVGFKDIDHHSGELYATEDWTAQACGPVIRWTTDPWDGSDTANALRWGTLFNFSFDADAPPQAGTVEIGLYRPGAGDAVSAPAPAPGEALPCPGDTDGNGAVDIDDIVNVVLDFGTDGSGHCGDADASGWTDIDDIVLVVLTFGSC